MFNIREAEVLVGDLHYQRGGNWREGTIVFIVDGAYRGCFARIKDDYYDGDHGRVYHTDVLLPSGTLIRKNLPMSEFRLMGGMTKPV